VWSTLQIVAVTLFFVFSTCVAFGQQHAQPERQRAVEQRTPSHSSPASQPGTRLHQHRDTWYEFLLKQFNPDDVDYGTWMEQRREAFLESSVRNPYFRYSAAATLALVLFALLHAKYRVDHRRSMWVTAEMMTDLYNHDAYSRQVARDAIQKYNEHIERCNRAVEAGEHGALTEGMESDVERYRAELQSVTAERDAYKRERDLAKTDLAEKERVLADMSFRLDALAKKSNGSREAGGVVDVRTADQQLVQHINNLQEQLYAEKRENKRLKGA
jgi:hypothetical protein